MMMMKMMEMKQCSVVYEEFQSHPVEVSTNKRNDGERRDEESEVTERMLQTPVREGGG